MSEEKCPFCGEPDVRHKFQEFHCFRCGTEGPDANGEYVTGRICDMHTYQRLLQAKDAEIERLQAVLSQLQNHELVMQEGGTNDADRAIRVMNKQQAKIERLRDALQGLVDEQNGPPLIKNAGHWYAAMVQACEVLGHDSSYYQDLLKELEGSP